MSQFIKYFPYGWGKQVSVRISNAGTKIETGVKTKHDLVNVFLYVIKAKPLPIYPQIIDKMLQTYIMEPDS